MDNYIVSARKYRPDSFDFVVGQDAITKTLKNAIRLNQVGQAYLFCGPRGVGKTTCARIFAKTINCTNLSEDYEVCNECESCVAFNNNRSLNIHELDAASNNSVDDIRNLIEQVRIPPQVGKYSVYIVDEVHMLSTPAFNAFLKTLEEPPKHVIFILATTEKHKIIPTILSRCQIFDFNRISVEDIRSRLEYVAQHENIEAEQDALHIIAQKADGAMRDALSIFDQIVSFSGNKITYEDTIKNLNVLDYDTYFQITDALVNGDYVKSLQILDNVIKLGFETNYFINGLASHFRDLLMVKDPRTLDLIEVGKNTKKQYIENSGKCSVEFLFRAIDIANNADLAYKTTQNKRLLIELALLKIANINNDISASNNKPTIKSNDSANHKMNTEENSPKVQETEISITKPNDSNIKAEEKKEQNDTEINAANTEIQTNNSKKIGISIKEMVSKNSKETKTKFETKEVESNNIINSEQNKNYNLEDVHKNWLKYAEFEKEKPRLHAFLKNHLPKQVEDNKFILIVENEKMKTYLENIRNRTLQFMRKELKNDNFFIEYSVGESDPRINYKSPSEQYEELLKNNPEFKRLNDELDLELE